MAPNDYKRNGDKEYTPFPHAAAIVKNYQNNCMVQGVPRLYTRDELNNLVPVKSWWIPITDIYQLIRDSQDKLNNERKGLVSGIRIYPALQDKDRLGSPISNDFHTLVYVATYQEDNDHNNIKLDSVQDFVEPCPKCCNANHEAELGY